MTASLKPREASVRRAASMRFCSGVSTGLATGLGLPVILVVGLRLGCLNHALLTAESILARGTSLAAWVANQVDPGLERREENLHTLASLLPAPCLGLVPWLADPTPAEVAGYLAIETLERVLNP